MNLNVKLIGYADYPNQGITHQEVLTPTILNQVFHNLKSFQPTTKEELDYLLNMEGPVFVSLKKEK